MKVMDGKKMIYLDAELDALLRVESQRRHESVSAVIRDILRKALQAAPIPEGATQHGDTNSHL